MGGENEVSININTINRNEISTQFKNKNSLKILNDVFNKDKITSTVELYKEFQSTLRKSEKYHYALDDIEALRIQLNLGSPDDYMAKLVGLVKDIDQALINTSSINFYRLLKLKDLKSDIMNAIINLNQNATDIVARNGSIIKNIFEYWQDKFIAIQSPIFNYSTSFSSLNQAKHASNIDFANPVTTSTRASKSAPTILNHDTHQNTIEREDIQKLNNLIETELKNTSVINFYTRFKLNSLKSEIRSSTSIDDTDFNAKLNTFSNIVSQKYSFSIGGTSSNANVNDQITNLRRNTPSASSPPQVFLLGKIASGNSATNRVYAR